MVGLTRPVVSLLLWMMKLQSAVLNQSIVFSIIVGRSRSLYAGPCYFLLTSPVVVLGGSG